MQKTLPLYHGPSVIGSAVLTYENGFLHTVAKTYASINGIYRAYIKGASGELLIGVLSPEGTAFGAKRSFSKSFLENLGLTAEDLTYAYVHCKDESLQNEWKNAGEFPGSFPENEIASALIKTNGALVDNVISPKKIALPLLTGRPFPRPDVLCLITPVRIAGILFGVIAIGKMGRPEKM